MARLKWIESAGGPLVLVSDKACKLWSGIYKRNSYLNGIVEDTDDFLDPDQTDYGKACLVGNYLGTVDAGNESILVFGDEPLPTTVFRSSNNEAWLARWYYCDLENNEQVANELFLNLNLNSIPDWEFVLTISFNSNRQYLFDSACDGKQLNNQNENEDFVLLQLTPGNYKVFMTVYEPNQNAKFFLHRLVLTD